MGSHQGHLSGWVSSHMPGFLVNGGIWTGRHGLREAMGGPRLDAASTGR